MFNFLKQKKEPQENHGNGNFFSRLKKGLSKTRNQISNGVSNLILGKKTIDTELLDYLETQLLTADMGVDVTQQVIKRLTQKLERQELKDSEVILQTLQEELRAILLPCQMPLIVQQDKKPFIILVVGINGSGKTTTIGKIAKYQQNEGHKVMLAAGDTFRAAAVEQLKIWGERNQIPVISQQAGADSAAVIFDAMESAKAKGMDLLLADTAGRLHTQSHLMDELKKIKKVLGKYDPSAPHEVLLVLDAGIGQNALTQAKQFKEAIGVTGLVITKLDGTAKGGIIFAIAQQLQIPIRFIGLGEGIDDLRPFVADEFVAALFDRNLD